MQCPAALVIEGRWYACDWPTNEDGRHPGWAHSNKELRAMWVDDRDNPSTSYSRESA